MLFSTSKRAFRRFSCSLLFVFSLAAQSVVAMQDAVEPVFEKKQCLTLLNEQSCSDSAQSPIRARRQRSLSLNRTYKEGEEEEEYLSPGHNKRLLSAVLEQSTILVQQNKDLQQRYVALQTEHALLMKKCDKDGDELKKLSEVLIALGSEFSTEKKGRLERRYAKLKAEKKRRKALAKKEAEEKTWRAFFRRLVSLETVYAVGTGALAVKNIKEACTIS
jgi:hypothetical protein